MSKSSYMNTKTSGLSLPSLKLSNKRMLLVGVILLVALLAFELFNFDTTQFALRSLLGDVTFAGLQWATILAIAFCAIDFAGLNRLFNSDNGNGQGREAWYLMGAWLLGATMNAVMTWWAVSLTLINNGYGNEVLSREQLLRYVPIFVAVLVWLTRILFIGAFTIAGDQLFGKKSRRRAKSNSYPKPTKAPVRRPAAARSAAPAKVNAAPRSARPAPKPVSANPMPSNGTSSPAPQRTSRVRQRPPMPNRTVRRNSGSIQA